MTEDEHSDLFEFPCEFPLKIMGKASPQFETTVRGILKRHGLAESAELRLRPSRKGNYVAISVSIQAESREQLDALYRELTANAEVLWAL